MLGYFGGFYDTWTAEFYVTFDGDTKTIRVNPGVTDIYVQTDLYSAWKEWQLFDETNTMKYLAAFRTFGGDPTVEGQVAPQYFFLTNGWRVVVDGQHVNFSTNLYTEEGDSPFIQINGGTISNATSDVPVVGITNVTAQDVWNYAQRGLTEIAAANVVAVQDVPVTSINDFKADLSSIPQEVWEYIGRTIEFTPEQEAKFDQILIDIADEHAATRSTVIATS